MESAIKATKKDNKKLYKEGRKSPEELLEQALRNFEIFKGMAEGTATVE